MFSDLLGSKSRKAWKETLWGILRFKVLLFGQQKFDEVRLSKSHLSKLARGFLTQLVPGCFTTRMGYPVQVLLSSTTDNFCIPRSACRAGMGCLDPHCHPESLQDAPTATAVTKDYRIQPIWPATASYCQLLCQHGKLMQAAAQPGASDLHPFIDNTSIIFYFLRRSAVFWCMGKLQEILMEFGFF